MRPIASEPSSAVTATMTVMRIMARGKSRDGCSRLLTYGDSFSQPPTANTRIASVVKYAKSKFGMKVSQVNAIVCVCASVIAGAARARTT